LEWYANETTWLDWALQLLGHPPLHGLFREASLGDKRPATS